MKRAVGALGALLLAAVPAFGLTTLVPDSFEVRGGEVGVSNGPLTFDAPTANLQRVRPAADGRVASPEGGNLPSGENATVLEDWQFLDGTKPEKSEHR